jgi:hypothetical protein
MISQASAQAKGKTNQIYDKTVTMENTKSKTKSNNESLQDAFLNRCSSENIPVDIFFSERYPAQRHYPIV